MEAVADCVQVSFGPQEYGVRALSLVRATIARVRVAYAQSVGIVLNNGWINRQAQCSFSRPRKMEASTERCTTGLRDATCSTAGSESRLSAR